MVVRKRVNVILLEDEYDFIKWLSERDGVSFQTEMQMIFQVELENLKDLYKEEMLLEQGEN